MKFHEGNMKYKINEIFLSVQGEGIDTGCLAVFVRMAGCNLSCQFCDTDYSTKFEAYYLDLFDMIEGVAEGVQYVVFTGGEPMLQNLYHICDMLKKVGYKIGLETNGLIDPRPNYFDSISFSPKTKRAEISLQSCDSLKILYPYLPYVRADSFLHFPAKWRGLQVIDYIDSAINEMNLEKALVELKNLGPQWRLSPQLHKYLKLK